MTGTADLTVVIFNPRAGSASKDELDFVARALGANCELLCIEEGEDPRAHVRAAVERHARAVVAMGGDGTVSAVASELVGSATRLGIIPRGTSNSVATALQVPHDLEQACAVIAQNHARIIDTACVGDKTMVLMATVGLHARAITDTTEAAKHAFGVFAYVSTGVQHLLGAEPFEVELVLEGAGTPLRTSVHALTVANIAPPRTLLAQGPPEVCPDDGLLDVTLLAFDGLLDALATSVHLYRHALEGLPAERHNVGFVRARQVAVRAEPEQRLMIDGELAGSTPFEVRCRPETLAVLTPAPAP